MSKKSISLVYKWVIFFVSGRSQGTVLGNFDFTQWSVMTVADCSKSILSPVEEMEFGLYLI